MLNPKIRFVDSDELDTQPADLLIVTCGYEARSRFIAEQLKSSFKKIEAFAYPDNRTLSFERNEEFFREASSLHEPGSVDEFGRQLRDLLQKIQTKDRPTRLAVDISSVDRERLARIVDVIYRHGEDHEIHVEFLYAVGAFESHSSSSLGTVMVNEPLPGFEGWTGDPSLPVACVIGLGFENLIALAALETLEPSRTVAFVARSDDPRFNQRVVEDNRPLITDQEVAVVQYDIERPFDSLQSLEDVVHALQREHRVVLVPLGPKVFALLALLVALEYRSEVAVWRVSGAQSDVVEDREPTGHVARLKIIVGPADADSQSTNVT